MTGKERFLKALSGGKPDRIPITDWLEGKKIFKEVLGKNISIPDGNDIVKCSMALGFDATFIAFGGFYSESSVDIGDIYKDEWGVTYKNTGVSWPFDAPYDYPIKTREDFKDWIKSKPNPNNKERLSDVQKALEVSQGKIAIVGVVMGPLTTATFLLGFTGTFLKLVDDPDIVEEIFKISNEFYIVGIDNMVDAGVDVIAIAEDLGFNTGTFASPDMYRRYLFPYLHELISYTRSKNIPVFLHSDGNINEVLDDLVSIGINAIHPIERKANMDIGKLRKRYGTRICLVGNISASDILPYGPIEKIEEEVKITIKIAGKEGAYILASDSDYHDGIPPKNFIAMVETAKKFGKYPIKIEKLKP